MSGFQERSGLSFGQHGAELFSGAVVATLPALREALASLPSGRAGVRIRGVEPLRAFLASDGSIGAIATAKIGAEARAVRAILFDKQEGMNWSLAWHQDRTICVQERVEVDGFGPWTLKHGLLHVSPPFELLTRMVTVRVHLDDVPATNAPLLIAPGSHRHGRVPESAVEDVVKRCGSYACLARAGDVWVYATPIVHASRAASDASRRRVLQVDFAAEELPGGLKWLEV